MKRAAKDISFEIGLRYVPRKLRHPQENLRLIPSQTQGCRSLFGERCMHVTSGKCMSKYMTFDIESHFWSFTKLSYI